MKPRQIKPDIYSVGAIDWDRRLFDELIPLPDGTSYNSYLVQGSEKTALIDTVDPEMTHVLVKKSQRGGEDRLHHCQSRRAGSFRIFAVHTGVTSRIQDCHQSEMQEYAHGSTFDTRR